MTIKRGVYATAVTAVIGVGALLAGCGGSDDNSTTTALSQSEFVAQATAICKPVNQDIEAAAQKYLGGGRPTSEDFEQFATAAVVPDTQKVIDGFKGLTPPSGQASAYAALIDELQAVNDQVKANPQLIAQGNPYDHANQLAKQAGLDACAAD